MCRLMPVMHERCTRQTKRLFGCHIDTAPSLTVEKAEPVCPWLPPGAMPGREVPAKARRRGHPRGHLATMMGTDLVPDAMTRLARCCTLPVQRCQRGDALLRAVAVITRPIDLPRPRSPGGKPLPGASPRVFRLQAVGPGVGPGGPRRSWARPRRPRRAGRAQARRTTGRATSGGKSALSPAAGGVSQALSTLGENPRGPLAPHAPLDAHSRGPLGLRGPRRPEAKALPPPGQPGREGGRPWPPLQGLALFGGEGHGP